MIKRLLTATALALTVIIALTAAHGDTWTWGL